MKTNNHRVFSAVLCLILSGATKVGAISGIAGNHAEAQTLGTSVSATLPSAVAQGDFVGCYFGMGSGGATASASSNLDGAYSVAIGPVHNTTSGRTDYIFYKENVSGGSTTVTATASTSTWLRLGCKEYSGVAASGSLDKVASATGTGTTASSGATAPLAGSGELAISGVETQAPDSFTAGSGYTKVGDIVSGNARSSYEDQILSSAAGIAGAFTISPSDNWIEVVATFKSSLQVTTSSLPGGTVGSAYSASLAASGGTSPYSWSLASGSLPSGLSLSSGGVISGTPVVAGTSNFTVQVADSAFAVATQPLSIAVANIYSSRTDLNFQGYTLPVPDVSAGANKIVTDPDFNSRILRLTDAATGTGFNFTNEPFATNSSGSGDENICGLPITDGSFLCHVIGSNHGGVVSTVFAVSPATFQGSRPFGNQTVRMSEFSRVTPDLGYIWTGNLLQKLDLSARSGNVPAPVTLFDVTSSSNCVPGGFGGNSAGGGLSGDDLTFAWRGGLQNSGVQVVVWRNGSGCRVWNTSTGQVTGDWGTTGTVSSGTGDEFNLHNVRMAINGDYVLVVPGSCLNGTACSAHLHVWHIPDLSVQTCTTGSDTSTSQCGAHQTTGTQSLFTPGFGSLPGQLWYSHPITNINSNTQLATTFPAQYGNDAIDTHGSWNNANSTDTNPILTTTFTTSGNNSNGATNDGLGGPSDGPLASAWYDEIIGISPTPQTVFRFAHTFGTNCPTQIQACHFNVTNAIGSVAPNGKYFIWASDWARTLGDEKGRSTCQTGPDANTNRYTTATWAANHSYGAGNNIIDPNGNVERAVQTGPGVSGSTQPTWPTTPGTLTTDGTVTWRQNDVNGNLCRGDVFVLELK